MSVQKVSLSARREGAQQVAVHPERLAVDSDLLRQVIMATAAAPHRDGDAGKGPTLRLASRRGPSKRRRFECGPIEIRAHKGKTGLGDACQMSAHK